MAVSQAPNMIYDLDEVPEHCRGYMVRGSNGYSFNQAIKDMILLEYHDIQNDNPLPELDIILVRDMLSFIPEAEQGKLVAQFAEKLKSRGIVMVGKNEELDEREWRAASKAPVSSYIRRD
jgi:purine-binding chemotaxis protein CheW